MHPHPHCSLNSYFSICVQFFPEVAPHFWSAHGSSSNLAYSRYPRAVWLLLQLVLVNSNSVLLQLVLVKGYSCVCLLHLVRVKRYTQLVKETHNLWKRHTTCERDTHLLKDTHNLWKRHTTFERYTQLVKETHNLWKIHTTFDQDKLQRFDLPTPNTPKIEINCCCVLSHLGANRFTFQKFRNLPPSWHPLWCGDYALYSPRTQYNLQRYCNNNIISKDTATHCNTLQQTAAHCNRLQHTAI